MRVANWVLVAAVGAVAAGVALIGFGPESGGFSAPDQACGVPISSSLVEQLLPSGDEFREYEPDPSPPPTSAVLLCRFVVDDEIVLAMDVSMLESPGPSAMETYRPLADLYGISVPHEAVIGGEEAVLGADGSLVKTACPSQGEGATLEINVKNHTDVEDSEENRERMARFTEGFMESVKVEQGC